MDKVQELNNPNYIPPLE